MSHNFHARRILTSWYHGVLRRQNIHQRKQRKGPGSGTLRASHESLEPRLLLSHGPVAPETGAMIFPQDPVSASSALVASEHFGDTVVIIDGGLEDYGILAESISTDADFSSNVELLFLDANRDGIRQISDALAGKTDLEAIHLLSHGSEGSLTLGNTRLDASTLSSRGDELASWGLALEEGGDLLTYSCDVASGEAGREFISQLSSVIGADVAASDDLTGSPELGGDWLLEYAVGSIETTPLFQGLADGYEGVLADLTVDSSMTIEGDATYGTITVDGSWTLTVNGNLTVTDAIEGDADADADNLTLDVEGKVDFDVITVGGNDELNDLTVAAPTIEFDNVDLDINGHLRLLAYASDELTWEDYMPFYENNKTETQIDVISSSIHADGDIIVVADSSNIRDSDLDIDFAALSSLVSMSVDYAPLISFSPDATNGDQVMRQYGS